MIFPKEQPKYALSPSHTLTGRDGTRLVHYTQCNTKQKNTHLPPPW